MANPRIPAPNRDVVVVERTIEAPAHAVFEVLANPQRHREIDGSGMVRDASKVPDELSLGATFSMDMKAGIGYRMVNTVVEYVPDEVVAWQPRPDVALVRPFIGGRIWKYVLEPQSATSTKVTEIWDVRQEKLPFLVRNLAPKTRQAMVKTLERLATVVEQA